jgi:hypothetical protein
MEIGMNKTLVAVLGAAASVSACAQASGEASGARVQRSFAVGGFERIEVAGPYVVEVRTGSAPSVQASGPERAIERLVVEVRGDRLTIHPRKQNRWGMNFGGSNWNGDKVRLTVTAPRLREAEIAGSGDMTIDRVQGESFAGGIAGSGNLSVGAVEVGELKLEIAGSGAATARSGRARNVEYEIAGSGDIDAAGIASETAAVSIAGSGNVRGQATRTADVEIAGSGDVELKGGARCTVSKAGSGEVRCS